MDTTLAVLLSFENVNFEEFNLKSAVGKGKQPLSMNMNPIPTGH